MINVAHFACMFLILFGIISVQIRSNISQKTEVIPIEGWVINSDENGFFDGSCKILKFFAHNAKIVNRYIMTSGVIMAMDGCCAFHVLFVSFCKCSA